MVHCIISICSSLGPSGSRCDPARGLGWNKVLRHTKFYKAHELRSKKKSFIYTVIKLKNNYQTEYLIHKIYFLQILSIKK